MQHDHVTSSSRHARPGALRFIFAFSLLGFTMLGGLGACEAPAPPFCEGGYVTPEGACEGKCDPTKCLAGNTCVGNRCILECDSHNDCLDDGTQNCAPAVEDGTNREIMACQPNGKNWGVGAKCPFEDECASLYSCSTTGEKCDLQQCGGAPDTCKVDEERCYARANCNIGKCPDGSPCTVFSCSPQECTANLACVTKGEGDADAYCTKNDCESDTDCPGGYYCGAMRDPRQLCDSMPQKGNNNLCGKVSINTPCVPASDLGNGNTLFEGQGCILRKACLKRNECAPCETDLDCSGGIANHCITMPNEATKRCARECGSNADCGRDFACQDVAGVGNMCVHKFGACAGSGKFCEPCLDDTDCGPLTGTSVCFTHNDGQRGCGDIAFPDQCTTSADCPKSPSGLPAYCVDDPGSPLHQRCYIFAINALDKATCW
ncbi:MAG: hypothetical protein IPM54_40185 [Polyangiaceae bacterium]|nr:hypothetical protein [Polyangiaceae bacterium]